MPEPLELGPLVTVDARTVPQRVEFSSPALLRRIQWIAVALACSVFVWAVALAAGWIRVSGWLVATQRFPRGAEHLLWSFPLLTALVCLALAVSGVRVSLDANRLAVFGVWPRALHRSFDLAALRRADFELAQTREGRSLYRMDFVFPQAEVRLYTPDRRTWEALRARFRDRLGR